MKRGSSAGGLKVKALSWTPMQVRVLLGTTLFIFIIHSKRKLNLLFDYLICYYED